MPARDPYEVLGVRANASDEQLRAAYRRLVQLHHPDHNRGSAESTRRFEEVQEAYSQIRRVRESGSRVPPRPVPDPDLDARLADMEADLRAAQAARERARQAAREAAASARPRRPTDEELGYVTTDDSFSKILADARAELSDRFAEAREHPVTRRVSDLIDELAAKLTGERRAD